MKEDSSHISKIRVVSNTHWDREFRWSFEKTRRRLLTMMDTTLDILESDPAYHSFTLDGHAILIDDYLELRPERTEQVKRFIQTGRLVAGPYYTLAEEFSIGHEALIRNLIWGRKTVEKYGGKCGTVAYTPSSWGQTGQLPQIFADFNLTKMMFYRGISHHESDAEWIWSAPDGTKMLASRFALYCRYNWYYQVHRKVSTGRVFGKDYNWGERDEVPFRFSDGLAGEDLSFILQKPAKNYNPSQLKSGIEDMVAEEGAHFTTNIFLAMNGHDISCAYPRESEVIADAKGIFAGKYDIEHTDLEKYWQEMEDVLDIASLPVLTGERRSYLKKGKWTFLFPGTISARTYLKLQDFNATVKLAYIAEPLAALAQTLGAAYPKMYLDRGWQALLSNHTHDANGGCAPDHVCQDMEYRYRQVADIGDIVTEDAMTYIAANISPKGKPADAMQLIAYNPLPYQRDVTTLIDLEIPNINDVKSVKIGAEDDLAVTCQPLSSEISGSFVDSLYDVPTILDSVRMKFYAKLTALPALGYRVYDITPQNSDLHYNSTMLTVNNGMENEYLQVTVNSNGTVNIVNKETGKRYENLNYLYDQGECGNAWKHVTPKADNILNSLGVKADLCVINNGPLVCGMAATYNFSVPVDYADGQSRSGKFVDLPVRIEYELHAGEKMLRVKITVDNRAEDHWLRAAFDTQIKTNHTHADSHFDVVTREIALPDSTGWVEPAGGTHPLRTFVSMSDGKEGLSLLSKGLFEYEALENDNNTLLLTILRACRIKLAVSEEKMAELPDPGVQCPGTRSYEYAIAVHAGDWQSAVLLQQAAEYYTPVRIAMTGRGQGNLPLSASLFTINNSNLHVTAVKGAEDGQGLIIRFFNPTDAEISATLTFGKSLQSASHCKMDESFMNEIAVNKNKLKISARGKKIVTVRVVI
jgi:hypothetical protein